MHHKRTIISLCLFFWLFFSFSLPAQEKKILFIMARMDVGGTERAFISLINNMHFPNATVEIYLQSRGGPFESLLRKDVRIITQKEMQKRTYDVAISFAQYISPEKWVDVVHAKKRVQWLHFDPLGNNDRFKVNSSWSKIDAFVSVSEAAKQRFILTFPQFSLKTHAIYNIIDNKGIHKASQEAVSDMVYGERTVTVVTLARLNRLKALDRAIRIHARLEKEGIHFRWYILGDGVEEKKLTALIQKNHLRKRFFLMGNKLNPYPYVARADIVALLSLEESYGLAMIEAKILGRPIIMTNTAAAKEIITNEVDGLVVDQNDESIYKGMKRIVMDAQLRKRFSKKNATYTFNNSSTYKKIEELFFKPESRLK